MKFVSKVGPIKALMGHEATLPMEEADANLSSPLFQISLMWLIMIIYYNMIVGGFIDNFWCPLNRNWGS